MAKKILVADDSPAMIALISSKLEAADYDVIAAENAKQAYMYVESKSPTLMILDMMMPGIHSEHENLTPLHTVLIEVQLKRFMRVFERIINMRDRRDKTQRLKCRG